MKRLSPTWILDGLIDYEYKKYILLDYFQKVESDLKKKKLFPHVEDLSNHLSFILQLKHSKNITTNVFPSLTPQDIIKFNFKYTACWCDNHERNQIEKLLNFALPKFRTAVMESSNIKREILAGMELEGVGHISSDISVGYIIIPKNKMHVYKYTIYEMPNQQGDLFQYMPERYIKLDKFKTYEKSQSPIDIKMDLLITNNHPNLCLFLVSSEIKIPLRECYIHMVEDLILENLY